MGKTIASGFVPDPTMAPSSLILIAVAHCATGGSKCYAFAAVLLGMAKSLTNLPTETMA